MQITWPASKMAPHSLHSALLLTRGLKAVHYIGNRVPFGMQTCLFSLLGHLSSDHHFPLLHTHSAERSGNNHRWQENNQMQCFSVLSTEVCDLVMSWKSQYCSENFQCSNMPHWSSTLGPLRGARSVPSCTPCSPMIAWPGTTPTPHAHPLGSKARPLRMSL